MSSYQFELALRQYVAAFDGGSTNKKISPEEFKTLFDNLYHKDFTYITKDGLKLTREQVYEREVQKLADGGTTVTLVHFRKIGLDCMDVKLGIVNGDEKRTVRAVSTISAGKAVISKEIDETTNFVYKWQEFGTFQTNM